MQGAFTTYYHSPVGVLRITGTDAFITTISFYDIAQKEESLQSELPPLLIQCVDQLVQYFNGELRQFSLPLNQSGTAFQQSVWQELQAISFGKTISYLELAKRMGDAKATRTVANANGKNNIAIVVPCHRVIGSNNQLTGYAGGLWRKQKLLELEMKYARGLQLLFE